MDTTRDSRLDTAGACPALPRSSRTLGRPNRGFTVVEMVICMGLLAVIVGMFVVALDSSSDTLMSGSSQGMITGLMASALHAVTADLEETNRNLIRTEASGLADGQTAVAMPSARDSSGVFQVSAAGRPVWQTLVVYCPYALSSGVVQLRRYTYPASAGQFPFGFRAETPITADAIYLEGVGGATVVVDRRQGNTALPAGQAYQVYSPGLKRFEVTSGAPSSVRLGIECTTRRGIVLAAEEVVYVAQRN
jgi:competence protein ComGC